ncbi:MAG: hypothetical protein H6664_06100 [Ardenticatenaceae bacterium]|nr:hypothetical protein [Ardenticatenaceae bacterium]MCB9003929.1 hypothetical protein [Ardenticatenaceae bacterium]
MTTKTQISIADIAFHTSKPTPLPLKQLYNWIIWQFPQPKEGGLCSVVHPPLSDHSWLPAIIHSKEKRILVYAHLDTSFKTPEEALAYFSNKA